MTFPEFRFIPKFAEYEDYRTAMPMSASDWSCFQQLTKAQEARRVYLNQHKRKPKTFAPIPPAEAGDRFGAMRRRIEELDQKIADVRRRA